MSPLSEALMLGIDLGTSSVRAAFIDARGEVSGMGQRELGIDVPAIGRAEQSPREWWRCTVEAVREGRSMAERNAGGPVSVLAAGFSGQMHGLVALGERDEPAYPAVIWADARGGAEADMINEAQARMGFERSCNKASVGFMLPTLLWMKSREPDTMRRIKSVMLPKDYICFRMTGRKVTEPSDASGTLAFDVRNGGWNRDLIEALSLPPDVFPEIVPTGSVVGGLMAGPAEELGLARGLPVVAGAADQAAGALGNGAIEPGTLLSTIGTAGQVFTPLASPMYDPELRTNTFCHARGGLWYLLGANMSAGYCLKWLKKNASLTGDYDAMSNRASLVPVGSRGVIFLPYLHGDRTPHQDASARAAFFGLAGGSGIDEVIRAVMEGVVYSMNEGVEIARSLGVNPSLVIASGGGARSRLWRQIQADVYGLPVRRSIATEQSCVGAAILAAVGIGLFKDIDEACGAMTRLSPETELPDRDAHARYQELFSIYRELYARNSDIFKRLGKFA
ncbi:MAG: xylulokinase [Synergistaceae bacterium]|nr:xylulokinase [Synergistaceae bacterium]